MLTHSGILMIRKGTKTGGLFFHQNLSPYDFPTHLFEFISKMKDSVFNANFNDYFDKIKIVPSSSPINEIDRKISSDIQKDDTWIHLSQRFENTELSLVRFLFSQNFSELPDVSTLIDQEDESDFSFTNHLYIVDLEERKISFFVGGIGYNFCRSLVYEQKFEDYLNDHEMNLEILLERYNDLLERKEKELNERWN